MEYLQQTIHRNLRDYLSGTATWLMNLETRYLEFPHNIVEHLPSIVQSWNNFMTEVRQQSLADFKSDFELHYTLPPDTTWMELRRLYIAEINKLDMRFKKFIQKVQEN